MDKERIVQKIITILEKEEKDIEEDILKLHATANNAPSPMESWSDSTRRERQSMASSMEITKLSFHQAILFLKNLDVKMKCEMVELGAIIQTDETVYCMIPFGGGKTFEYDGVAYKTITPDSKLGIGLMGKRKGETAHISLPVGERTVYIGEII